MFDVELDLIEVFVPRTEQTLDLLDEVVFAAAIVVLSQKVGLLDGPAHFLPELGFSDEGRNEVVELLAFLEHLDLRISQKSPCVGYPMHCRVSGGAEMDGMLLNSLI